MAAFPNSAIAPQCVIFINLNIHKCFVDTAYNYCLHLHFLHSLDLSSAVFSMQINNRLYSAVFLVVRKYCSRVSVWRPSFVEVARLSSWTPRHSSLPLSAMSRRVHCDPAVIPLQLLQLRKEDLSTKKPSHKTTRQLASTRLDMLPKAHNWDTCLHVTWSPLARLSLPADSVAASLSLTEHLDCTGGITIWQFASRC